MCVNPISVPVRMFGKVIDTRIVACGKCHECLARMANGYVQRYYLEAIDKGSMHFVTLTYDNEHLPFWLTDEFGIRADFCLSKKDLNEIRQLYSNAAEDVINNHLPVSISYCGITPVYSACPSLCRSDVSALVKKFRKEKGYKFTFSFIGEYGKKGRPHYHGVLFGLDDKQSLEFCDTWKKGFTLVKSVPLVAEFGKSNVTAVAKYIAKYMHKGSFEDWKVRDGLVEAPRAISSMNLGLHADFDKLSAWYLAKDRFPNVSIHDSSFTDEYLTLVESRLKQFNINGINTPLSKNLYQQIFYYDYTHPLSKKTYKKASSLSLVLANRLQSKLEADFEEQFDRVKKDGSSVSRFIDSQNAILEDRATNSRRVYHRFISGAKL